MKYRLVYTRRALRDIDGLDDLTKKRIGKTLARYESKPLNMQRGMTNSRLGSYRFRIGDFRVIFDVEGKDIVVLRDGASKGSLQAFIRKPTEFPRLKIGAKDMELWEQRFFIPAASHRRQERKL